MDKDEREKEISGIIEKAIKEVKVFGIKWLECAKNDEEKKDVISSVLAGTLFLVFETVPYSFKKNFEIMLDEIWKRIDDHQIERG